MAVAGVALFVSLGGTSVAAVNYARNAGAVDGKSAVSASGTTSHAAGRLVATSKSGPDKGRIPGKFLAGVPRSLSFGKAFEVADNAPGAPVTVGDAAGVGTLTATCNDQSPAPGVEDPTTTLNFVNASGDTINMARRVGNGDGSVSPQANQTVAPLTIAGSNTFFFHVQTPKGINLLIDGVVRQDGRGSAAANCLVYGTVLEIS
jgi:hypothetical protein